MELQTKTTTIQLKSGSKTISKTVLLMQISRANNTWVEAREATEEEYHRLRELYGYQKY